VKRFLILLSMFVLTATLTATLSATTLVPVSVERLTQVSTHVLEGRAQSTWSAWNQQHSMIYTYTRFTVGRTLKGQAPATVVVKQLGGTVGNTRQRVAGVRYWQAAEEAVLFLRPAEELDGTMVVTGMVQGNFLISRSASGVTVSNGSPGTMAYNPAQRRMTEFQGKHMTLDELETRVQKAVR
jgi:hypothetical protein